MGKFQADKFKVNLKLAINRLKMLQSKKAGINAQARREIATLLDKGKEESARIRVEQIIREDFNSEAMEILELYCEMLVTRIGLLEQLKECDPSISEAVNTVIYAAPRSSVKELNVVQDILISKFGIQFGQDAMENKNDVVSPRIVHKLKMQTPDPFLVNQYLKEIAAAYNVNWDPATSTAVPEIGNSAGAFKKVELNEQTFPVNYQSDIGQAKASEVNNNLQSSDNSNLHDFDELSRRFEALKKRN